MVVVYMVVPPAKSRIGLRLGLGLSCGLHAALALWLWRHPTPASQPARARQTATRIEFLSARLLPPPAHPPAEPPRPPQPPTSPRELAPAAEPRADAGRAVSRPEPRRLSPPPSLIPPPDALPPRPPSAATEHPKGRIDLFPQSAMCQAIGCSQGQPPAPGQGLASHLAEEQAQREGLASVREGRVAPGWREVEHDLERLFVPKPDSVSTAWRGELALRQLVRPVQPAPENSQTGWLVRRDDMNRLQAEIRAAQDAYDEAAVGREAEVEVELDSTGSVVAVRLLLRSGSREFDREALRAVQQAVRVRPLHDPQGPVIARYALRGELAVNLPRIGSAVEPNGGQVHSQVLSLAGTFDEVSGKANVRVPFLKRLKTRIRLISVRRKLGAPSP